MLSHSYDDHAALGHRVAPLAMVHAGIVVAGPFGVRSGQIEGWTITASPMFLATKDFINDPWFQH